MNLAVLLFVVAPAGGGGGPILPEPALRQVTPRLEYYRSGPSPRWIDITKFWRVTEPIVCEYGIQGSDPAVDHIADAGQLAFTLDDGARLPPLGVTAPQNPMRLYGWDLNAPIRFSLGSEVGTRYYKFLGSLADVVVDANPHGERVSRCTALDVFDDFAQTEAPFLPTVEGVRSDVLVGTILDSLPYTVSPREIDVGVETFPVAFDGAAGQGLMVREALQQIALSEFGYIYRKGNLSTGSTFVYENRSRRVNNPPVLAALTDLDITAIEAPASRDDIYRNVKVTVHPLRLDTSDVVLYSLESSLTTIADGQTLWIVGAYRNPDSPDQLVGALTSSMIQPVAYTDYLMNVSSDGLGTDLTLGFSVVGYYSGSQVKFQIHNASGSAAFILQCNARGRGLYRSDATYDGVAVTVNNQRTMTVDMPFQSSLNTAGDVATLLVNNYGQALGMIRSVTLCATRSPALLEMAFQREPGDRITVTNAITGFVAVPATINSVRYELQEVKGDAVLWCTWGLEPAPSQIMWQLDMGALDTSTTLGF